MNTMVAEQKETQDLQAVRQLKEACARIKAELGKVIVGQQDVVDQVLISILTRSHALLVGVPGLAKTLLISTLSQTLHLSFKRINAIPFFRVSGKAPRAHYRTKIASDCLQVINIRDIRQAHITNGRHIRIGYL